MYIAEAIPTVAIGVITFSAHGSPAEAKILTAGGTNWSSARSPPNAAPRGVRNSRVAALYNPKVLLLALNYVGIVTAAWAC